MNKQLRTLGIAGLVSLAGFLASGCGTTDDVIIQGTTQQVNEVIIIPQNTTPGTLTLKFINLLNGTSVFGQQGVNSGGNGPEVVKVHPTRPQFFVGNTLSNNVASFAINGNAGVGNLGAPVAAPAGVRLLAVHPNGAFLYAAGGANIQTYAIQPDGSLVASGAAVALAGTVGDDAAFSNGGNTLHIPVQGFIQSFAVNGNTGALTAPVNTALAAAGDQCTDVNVHPNGTCLIADVAIGGGLNDSVRSYALTGGTLGAVTVQNFTFDIGSGEMARNGQFFLGQTGAPANLRGYNVNAATGAITEFANSPQANPNSSFLMGLDPSQQFIFSVGGGTLDVRGRVADGTMSGVTSDNAGVNANSRRFDFFQYVQNI
ncbi:hypothetical protein IV102_05580 [bacterium]|nr:hypothetical protein [bacterium]